MRLSVALSNDETGLDPALLVEQARVAERLGYSAVWLPDHPLAPEPYGDVYGGVHEPLILLAHLAAVTSRITLGTSVVIVPLREPVTLAKQLATIERLAPGRLVFGVGVGWESREFEALGVPFTERGARTDETLALIGALHRGETPAPGRFFGTSAGSFEPRLDNPVRIMVGGVTPPALRRAARVGDHWQAFGLSPEEFRVRRAELDAISAPRRLTAGVMLSRLDSGRPVAEVVELLHRYEDAGADEITIHFGPSASTPSAMAALMQGWRPDHRS